MKPIFRKGPRGKAFVRVPDGFYCPEDNVMGRGRKRADFLTA